MFTLDLDSRSYVNKLCDELSFVISSRKTIVQGIFDYLEPWKQKKY